MPRQTQGPAPLDDASDVPAHWSDPAQLDVRHMRQMSESAVRAAPHAYARSLDRRMFDLREWLTVRCARRAAALHADSGRTGGNGSGTEQIISVYSGWRLMESGDRPLRLRFPLQPCPGGHHPDEKAC
jgi:hypothetical protein